MQCEKCLAEVTVLRFRRGRKRSSTSYVCNDCGKQGVEWRDNTPADDSNFSK